MSRSVEVRASFTVLLGVLGCLLAIAPLLSSHSLLRFLMEAVTLVTMSAVVLKTGRNRRYSACVVAAGLAMIASGALRILSPNDVWIIARHLSSVAFILLVTGSITYVVWTEREVTIDTIVGGIAVYVLLAIAWSSAYQALEFSAPGSFVVANEVDGRWGPWEPSPGLYPRLFFFSFVTLTTLGYGDLVPASAASASLASLEAIVGPLYLTILIARLVGLHMASGRAGAGESEPPG